MLKEKVEYQQVGRATAGVIKSSGRTCLLAVLERALDQQSVELVPKPGSATCQQPGPSAQANPLGLAVGALSLSCG